MKFLRIVFILYYIRNTSYCIFPMHIDTGVVVMIVILRKIQLYNTPQYAWSLISLYLYGCFSRDLCNTDAMK